MRTESSEDKLASLPNGPHGGIDEVKNQPGSSTYPWASQGQRRKMHCEVMR